MPTRRRPTWPPAAASGTTLLVFVSALVLRRRDDYKLPKALAVDAQQGLALGFRRPPIKVADGIHRMAIDAVNDITLLEDLRGGTIGVNIRHHNAPRTRRQTQLLADFRREVLHRDAT